MGFPVLGERDDPIGNDSHRERKKVRHKTRAPGVSTLAQHSDTAWLLVFHQDFRFGSVWGSGATPHLVLRGHAWKCFEDTTVLGLLCAVSTLQPAGPVPALDVSVHVSV